jgi:HK97 family phage prohead protease
MPYKPTEGMVTEAQRGLDWRSEFGRGGTEVGIARARDIVNGRNLSEDTVKRMFSFFSRHEVDKQAEGFRPGEEGYPSNGRIAWALWGGDAGFSWSREIAESLDDERSMQNDTNSGMIDSESEDQAMTEEVRAEPDELSVGDYVEWDSSGGEAYGRIDRIERDGQIDVPDADVVINGDAEDPAALIEVYREGEEGYEASGVMVGHRFSTLRKVAERGYKDKDRFNREDMQTRAMTAGAKVIDEERRTVRIAISSEEPVERNFGAEILDHSEGSIDLKFARSGRMPLLLDHDPRQQIGVVENVEIDSATRRLRGTVRFGKGALANEIYTDVVDDIRGNISVGYSVNKMDKEGKDRYRVSSWTPMEVSVVSIPADRTVGVGRSAEDDLQTLPATPIMETPMTENTQIDMEAVKAEAARAAAKDTAEMLPSRIQAQQARTG